MFEMIVAFIFPDIPNPRILKRVKIAAKSNQVHLIYWDKLLKYKHEFSTPEDVLTKKISIKCKNGINVQRVLASNRFRKQAIDYLTDIKPDILHVCNLDMLYIAVDYKNKYKEKCKIIYEVADLKKYVFKEKNLIKNMSNSMMRNKEKQYVKFIDVLILTSEYYWDYYYKGLNIDQSKFLYIPNVPEKKLFDDFRKVKHDAFTIGFFGNIRYKVQILDLIEVIKQTKNTKLIISGYGIFMDDVIRASENCDRIEILGSFDYNKDIVHLYQKIDCVYAVYDSYNENVKIAIPNKLYEAIVCELPILVAEGTKLGEFVIRNKIGNPINSNHPSELKNEINKLRDDLNYYEEIVNNESAIKEKCFFEYYESDLESIYK